MIVSRTIPPTIVPLTADNLQKFGIAPLPPEMKVLPSGLSAIGPLFVVASLAALVLQSCLELRIQTREAKRAAFRAGAMRKDFDLLNKKESILAYMDDLHRLIRQNLDEMKEKIAQRQDRKKLR